jgi:hypothetical protein
MQNNTNEQFDKAVKACREIFLSKSRDYGTSWRVYRQKSLADQIYIKAKRIRTIQEKRQQMIVDDIPSEFMGILNYAIIGLIQLDLKDTDTEEIDLKEAERMYDEKVAAAKKLMQDKNHDYGEAWREMSQESFVDLILSKVLRIKQILSNEGKTLISEGIDSNLYDILNYAVFAIIMASEQNITV